MRAAATILALCALMTGAARAQDCQLKQYGSVDMHVANEQVSLPASIGGVERDFVFNIAGTFNRISQDLVDKLDLQIRSLPPNISISISGKVRYAKAAIVPELVLGNVKLKDVEFLVVPREAGDLPDTISVGVFGKTDLELDMAGKKLKFFSQDHCPGKVVYWTQAFSQVPLDVQEFGFVRPKMQLDGRPVTVALNLNSPSIISLGAMQALFGLDENAPGMTLLETGADGVNIYRYPFKTLGAEELKVANPAIRVVGIPHGKVCSGRQTMEFPDPTHLHTTETPRLATCYGGSSLILGYSVLSKLRMYFSIKEKLMYLSAADAR